MLCDTRTASVAGMLSVMISFSIGEAGDARDGAAREHAVRRVGGDRGGAELHQRAGGVAQRAGGIDDVVDEDATAAAHVADDVHHLGDAGLLAPLVDDGEVAAEPLGDRPRAEDAADVGRDDQQVLGIEPRA